MDWSEVEEETGVTGGEDVAGMVETEAGEEEAHEGEVVVVVRREDLSSTTAWSGLTSFP